MDKFDRRLAKIPHKERLTIERISRLLSKFKKGGLLRVSNREIELLDPPMLKAITAGTQTCH